MRVLRGGISHTAWVIEDDLNDRDTGLQKPHITGLADITACALACRSVNSSEWVAVLPRRTEDEASKARYMVTYAPC